MSFFTTALKMFGSARSGLHDVSGVNIKAYQAVLGVLVAIIYWSFEGPILNEDIKPYGITEIEKPLVEDCFKLRKKMRVERPDAMGGFGLTLSSGQVCACAAKHIAADYPVQDFELLNDFYAQATYAWYESIYDDVRPPYKTDIVSKWELTPAKAAKFSAKMTELSEFCQRFKAHTPKQIKIMADLTPLDA